MSTQLERLALRVQADPFFLASVLARYAESQSLDDHALATRLGCDGDTLTHLRLCRNPDSMPPHFWNDVERIAGRFHLDPDRLAEIVRFGQALIQGRPPADAPVNPGTGYLMAAREDAAGQPPLGKDS
jgi:hypothetical protein